MRQTYAASLAAVSICGYIVGVGDRHTENFLLHPASGELIPIDFGCPSKLPHMTKATRPAYKTSSGGCVWGAAAAVCLPSAELSVHLALPHFQIQYCECLIFVINSKGTQMQSRISVVETKDTSRARTTM